MVSEVKLKKLEMSIDSMREKLVAKDEIIRKLSDFLDERTDELDQYSRRSSMRIMGIPEVTAESTDDLATKVVGSLGVEINTRDIDRSHRVGRRDDDKPRTILVKFVSHRGKTEVMRAKKNLKSIGTKKIGAQGKIFINEDLTRLRAQIAATSRLGA